MNLTEVWFGCLTRKDLRGGGFTNSRELTEAVQCRIDASNNNAKPCVWRKREAKGSQLRNATKNLRD
jgi:hypothetical protein